MAEGCDWIGILVTTRRCASVVARTEAVETEADVLLHNTPRETTTSALIEVMAATVATVVTAVVVAIMLLTGKLDPTQKIFTDNTDTLVKAVD